MDRMNRDQLFKKISSLRNHFIALEKYEYATLLSYALLELEWSSNKIESLIGG